jgi:hypothetical protein
VPAELQFFITIHAPLGLAGIEPHLAACSMNFRPHRSGFNGQVILYMASGEERFEFQMNPSTTDEMTASGQMYLSEPESWELLASFSECLRRANFPHEIGMDDANGNLYRETCYKMPTSMRPNICPESD